MPIQAATIKNFWFWKNGFLETAIFFKTVFGGFEFLNKFFKKGQFVGNTVRNIKLVANLSFFQ